MSHFLDGVNPRFFPETGVPVILEHRDLYSMANTGVAGGRGNLDEYYVLASLLNRAHYLLFGEPITSKEQTINMVALILDYDRNMNPGGPKNTRPKQIKYPPVDIALLPIPILDAVTQQLHDMRLGRTAIMDPALADSWLAFYAMLAM